MLASLKVAGGILALITLTMMRLLIQSSLSYIDIDNLLYCLSLPGFFIDWLSV